MSVARLLQSAGEPVRSSADRFQTASAVEGHPRIVRVVVRIHVVGTVSVRVEASRWPAAENQSFPIPGSWCRAIDPTVFATRRWLPVAFGLTLDKQPNHRGSVGAWDVIRETLARARAYDSKSIQRHYADALELAQEHSLSRGKFLEVFSGGGRGTLQSRQKSTNRVADSSV